MTTSSASGFERTVGVRRDQKMYVWGALLCCAIFLGEALAVLPYPGIQNDEALFAGAIYYPRGEIDAITVAGNRVPLMLMSYVGTLKSLLYSPVFEVLEPTVYTVRLPMVLLGAATVWMLFILLRSIAGGGIALLGAALLATDPTFVLCTTFDWGPVAIQVSLFTGSVLLLRRYTQSENPWALYMAALLAGLAMWNKAIFLWSLLAFAVALVAVYRRRTFATLTIGRISLAATLLLVGSLPLIAYNLRHQGATLMTNAHVSAEQRSEKLAVLRASLDGSALIDYVASSQPVTPTADVPTSTDSVVRLASSLGFPVRTLLPLAVLLSVTLLPLVWHSSLRNPALVALLFCIVHYAQMFFVKGAGTGSHHVVLLYPGPHAFVALCLGGAVARLRNAGPAVLFGIGSVLVVSGVLVNITYIALLRSVGSPVIWTDAIVPLERFLTRAAPKQVVVMDWGILASLRLTSAGRLPLVMGSDGLERDPVSPDTEARLAVLLQRDDWLFVTHTKGNEIFADVRQRLDALAARQGFRPHLEATIADSKGRPVFEVFRYEDASRRARLANGGSAVGDGLTSGTWPQRGAFYYQPNAAHWWFWERFDLASFSRDIGHFREANLDTISFDIQVRDFVDQSNPTAVRLRPDTLAKLLFALHEAERQQIKVLLVLWYTNGLPDPSASGGARLIQPERFRVYLEMTRQLAAMTRGHAVTFFFTNELFDLRAEYDAPARRWRLQPFGPASASFAEWARRQDPSLERWNKQWGTAFGSWDALDLDSVFPRQEYWNWLASVIRSRLPALAAVIKRENPAAKVGYEDYTFVYGWADSGIPSPCPLDYIGFGIYRDMVISTAELADKAYEKLTAAFPGVTVFVPEVGMDTDRHNESEQAEWFASIAAWAQRRGVGINILMWRDYNPKPDLPTLAEARYGLWRVDGMPKPAVRALGSVGRR